MSAQKFPLITALVPAGEHFEEAVATVNEGIYLTVPHFEAIESTLAANEAALATAHAASQTAADQLAAAQTALQAANETIATLNGGISTLQARVTKLENLPAGSFSEGGKEGDELPAGNRGANQFNTTFDAEAKALKEKIK